MENASGARLTVAQRRRTERGAEQLAGRYAAE